MLAKINAVQLKKLTVGKIYARIANVAREVSTALSILRV